MRVFIMAGIIVVGLAFLLIWRNSLISAGVYRVAFFVGLAALVALLFSGASGTISLGPAPLARVAAVPFLLVVMAPFILLFEVGVAGYRGFSSWMRYLSLVLAVLGVVGFIASLILPKFLRR